jgi:hypothetical protein
VKLQHLFLRDHDSHQIRVLLNEWRWLLGRRSVRPVALSTFGDWFLEDKRTGEILFLDIGMGELELAAPSRNTWRRDCGRRRQDWLLAGQHALLLGRGLRLRPGECFGWKIPPCLGGSLLVENFEVTPLAAHQRLMAQLTRKMKMEAVLEEIEQGSEPCGKTSSMGPLVGAAASVTALAAFFLRWL